MTPYTSEETHLAQILKGVALAALLLGILCLIFAYNTSFDLLFITPFLANTAPAFGLLALLSWIAAGDVRRFRKLIYIVIGVLAFGVALSALFSLTPYGNVQITFLVAGAVIAALGAGAISWGLIRAKPIDPLWLPWLTEKSRTEAERVAQVVFGLLGLCTLVLAAGVITLAFAGIDSLLMIMGAVIELVLVSVFALWAALNIRRSGEMILLLVLGCVISFFASGITLISANRFISTTFTAFNVGTATVSIQQYLVTTMVISIVLSAILLLVYRAMSRALIDYISFFSPLEFRALEAISDTLIEGGANRAVPPYQIALRTDRYLSSFPSHRLALARLAISALEFGPLLTFQPPASLLNPIARREFVDRYFKRDIVDNRGVYWLLNRPVLRRLIDFIEGATRFNMQLTYMGYYSDPKVHELIGYVPFSERPKSFAVKPIRRYPALRVMTPDDLCRAGTDIIPNADVVIIGTGAAGATMAEQLAEQGRDVLLLEKGKYVAPDDFSEDEIDMVGRLYADGALQISQALRFSVLQGSCVGGSTVINNAVCFDTPETVLERWNDPQGMNAGIDVARFREAQKAVRERMSIGSLKNSTKTRTHDEELNPGDNVIMQGAANFLEQGSYEYDVVNANIVDCLGCGYCNIGCKYGRKLSMLDEVLPKAQQAHPDRFRVISEAQATRLNGSGGKVNEIVVSLRDGRKLSIRNPKTVILSAGTIASSWLLMQSGIGRGELPVGRHICFNMGSPLHGYWEQPLNSYAGLQIAHYLKLSDKPGFVYETWYNPPVAQSLSMPGWLDTHFKNMGRYNHMAAVGVLVGTETNAYITPALFLRGNPDIVYEPTEHDLDTLCEALTTLGQIMFAGGAKEVFANTRSYRSYQQGNAVYRSEDDLKNLRKVVKDDRDIFLGTGHPQGGNAISKNRGKNGRDGGVINPEFKVYGYDNLYVCDGSVHPGPTTVNPQLTIMTMARYASSMIK